jgi:hypothetical protein
MEEGVPHHPEARWPADAVETVLELSRCMAEEKAARKKAEKALEAAVASGGEQRDLYTDNIDFSSSKFNSEDTREIPASTINDAVQEMRQRVQDAGGPANDFGASTRNFIMNLCHYAASRNYMNALRLVQAGAIQVLEPIANENVVPKSKKDARSALTILSRVQNQVYRAEGFDNLDPGLNGVYVATGVCSGRPRYTSLSGVFQVSWCRSNNCSAPADFAGNSEADRWHIALIADPRSVISWSCVRNLQDGHWHMNGTHTPPDGMRCGFRSV